MEADLYFTESCNSGLAYGQTQHDLASTRPIRPPGPGNPPPGGLAPGGGRFIYESRHVTGASEGHWIWMVEFLGSCLCSFLGMDSCRMPFSNLAATSPASTSSPT